MKIGRNEPCHCGSGNKYKKCCAEQDRVARAAELAAAKAAAEAAAAEAAAQALDDEASEGEDQAKVAATTETPRKAKVAPPKKHPVSTSHRPTAIRRRKA